jgi:hypothetical protein
MVTRYSVGNVSRALEGGTQARSVEKARTGTGVTACTWYAWSVAHGPFGTAATSTSPGDEQPPDGQHRRPGHRPRYLRARPPAPCRERKGQDKPGGLARRRHSTSGVEGRGRQLKVEVVPVWSWPVRVNAVSPGIIKTPVHPAGSYEELGGRLPQLGRGRPGQRRGGRRLVPGILALRHRGDPAHRWRPDRRPLTLNESS